MIEVIINVEFKFAEDKEVKTCAEDPKKKMIVLPGGWNLTPKKKDKKENLLHSTLSPRIAKLKPLKTLNFVKPSSTKKSRIEGEPTKKVNRIIKMFENLSKSERTRPLIEVALPKTCSKINPNPTQEKPSMKTNTDSQSENPLEDINHVTKIGEILGEYNWTKLL